MNGNCSIRVLFFASLTDITGCGELDLSVVEGTTVDDLRQQLGRTFPGLEKALPRCRAAKRQRFVNGDVPLEHGDEIAFIPPVSGG